MIDTDYLRPAARWGGGNITISTVKVTYLPVHYEFRRRDGIVYYKYSYNGFDSGWVELYNQSNWNLNQYYTDNIVFGARIVNGSYDRFFKGTVSDIEIAVAE